jgi:hypothetical protein
MIRFACAAGPLDVTQSDGVQAVYEAKAFRRLNRWRREALPDSKRRPSRGFRFASWGSGGRWFKSSRPDQ